MRRKPAKLTLSSTPRRVGPIAALTLLELALRRDIWLSESDLVELEHVVIGVLSDLHDDLLALEPLEDGDLPVTGD